MDQALGGLIEIPLQVAYQTGAVVNDAHDHRCHPGARAGQHLACAVMEIEMPQGVDVVDFKAAHLQAFEPVACSQCASGGALGSGLAKHALRFEVAAHRGVRRHGGVAALEGGAQVVKVQLRSPAGVLAVLRHQGIDHCLGHTGKAGNVATQAVLQCGYRVSCTARGVIPALQRGGTEGGVKSGAGVAPGLGGKQGQLSLQFTALRRCCQQGANDCKAQAGPSIAPAGVVLWFQITLQSLQYRRYRLWV